MRYGRFDDDAREYVIERPDTPMSWVNYLGTSEYCGIVSNNAAGYAFHRSSLTGRMLRFRFNSIPMDRPGRYVYLRDNESADYWSATWQPVAKPLDQYRSECRHGLGYTRFESEYSGIRTRYRVHVPVDRPLEVWELEVENASGRARELSLFAYAEWCFWNNMQDLTNFQYILYTCRMGFADDMVDYSIRLWPFSEPKGFMASVLPVASFDTDRDEFIGPYRHEGTPIAVERGKCSGSIAMGGNPCGGIENRVSLAPGATARACWVVGVGDARTAGREAKARYADPEAVERDLAELERYWDARLGRFACRTPSPEMNSMLNVWNQYQCQTTFNWSRSASFNESGGRDGLGFRDSNQDTLGVMHSIPGLVRPRLVELLKAQHSDGSAMHGVQPLTWRQGPHNRSEWVFSDDHLWLLLTVPAYIKETADFAFLDERVPFADAGDATVWEHLVKAVDFSWSKRGPHGLLLGLAADWNDCLNLRGKGESLFSTFLCARGMRELIELAKRAGRACQRPTLVRREAPGREGYVPELEERLAELLARIDEHVWDGAWFRRGFLDDGRVLGGAGSDQSRIFINSQTWAVIAGAAPRERLAKAMDSLREHLATEHGIVKNFPAYREHDPVVGAITTFPPGLKENAGIFCHANTWAVVAEGMLGRGDRAFEFYRAYLPAAKNETADLYTMEPYVYSQFITGKEHPSKFGRARNSWLTGAASWSFAAATQHILGIRAGYDGLVIDPSIPPEWDGFEATRVFRGATYRISVKNPDRVSSGVRRLVVDGRELAGTVVPPAPEGATVEVELELGG